MEEFNKKKIFSLEEKSLFQDISHLQEKIKAQSVCGIKLFLCKG